MVVRVEVKLTRLDPGLPLPAYQSAGASGLDLHAARTVELLPLGRDLCPTGVAIALPEGYEAQVRPRSGLAARLGVTVLNSPGTVDADYRGEILVPLVNLGSEPVRLERGTRIAQLVVAPVCRAELVEVPAVSDLGPTARGTAGFGSTGAR